MTFQYYIIDLDEGTVVYSNNIEYYKSHPEYDYYMILDTKRNIYYLGSTKEYQIKSGDDDEEDS